MYNFDVILEKPKIYIYDVIQITDKDLLNAMAYTLYGMSYQEVKIVLIRR